MNSSETEIILERRYGRNALGCVMVLMIIVFFVCMAIDSSILFELLIFFGILFVLALLSFLSISSGKNNIILTVNGLSFREGVWFKKRQMEISWSDIGEIKFVKKISRSDSGVESEYFQLHLKEKIPNEGVKLHRVEYCGGFGRQVLNSTTTFTAERAVELIEKLCDAGSEKARIQILKDNNKGKNPEEVRKRLRNVPWKHRLVRYCPACKGIFVVDGRKEKSEQRCHSCGSNEIYEDEDEYLKTIKK